MRPGSPISGVSDGDRRRGPGTRSSPGRAPGTTGRRAARRRPRAAGGRRPRAAADQHQPARRRTHGASRRRRVGRGRRRSGSDHEVRERTRASPHRCPAGAAPLTVVALVDALVGRALVDGRPCRPRPRRTPGRRADRSTTTHGLRARRLGRAAPARPGRARHVARHRRRRRARGHPAARPVPLHRRDDGRGLHALLPRAHAPAATCPTSTSSTSTDPGSLQVLIGWYERVRPLAAAERTFGLLQHLGIILGLFALARAWGRLAATAVAALVGVLRADADRPDGDGLERRPGPDAVERRVRRARACTSRRPPAHAGWAWLVGRRAGRAGAHASGPTSSSPSASCSAGCCWRHAASRRPVADRRRRRADADVGAPRDGRPGRRRSRAWSSTRCSTSAPGASCPGRRRGAGSTAALQAVAEEIPPWWRFPHLSASHTLFLWFFLMLLGTVGAGRPFAIWQRRRGRRTGRSTVLLAVALVSVGILPQALQRPGLGPPATGSRACRSRSRSSAVVEVVAALAAAARPPRPRSRPAAPSPSLVTFTFTALFTFRYYLLHTRVGLGQVPSAFPVERDGRYFYLGDYEAYVAVQAAVDELDRLGRARRPAARRAARPAPHLVQRRLHLLAVPRARAGHVLHRDGSRPGQRRGLEPRRRRRLGRLGDPHRAVGRLDGAQLLDGLRLRRAEPGAPRPVLRGRQLRGRPGHPLLPQAVAPDDISSAQRQAAPDGAGEVAEDAEHRAQVAGTHTVRRPLRRASTVASATAAGVVASGAAFMPGGHPGVARSPGARRARWRPSRPVRRPDPGRTRRGRPSTTP